VLQMEAVECGAAALAIVLAHYGRHVPLERLRIDCGVSRDGVNARNLLQAARAHGLVGNGQRKELDALRELPVPAILFWNFNHFLVLEGFSGNRAFLNDPATGPRSIDLDELDEGFTGVVIALEPGPKFVLSGTPPGLIGPLRRRLSGSESAVAFATIAGLALVVPGLLMPGFVRIFVDQVLVGGLSGWLWPLLAGMALTAVVRGALTALRERYLLRLETKLAVTTSSRFFWHVLHLPMEFYNQRYAGDVSTRVKLNDRVASLLSGQLASTVIDVVMILFYAALMFVYDWQLALIGVVAVVLIFLTMQAVARRRVDGSRRLLQERGKFMGVAMNGLQNIETVKAGGIEGDLFTRIAGYQAKLIDAHQNLWLSTQVLTSAPPLITGLAYACVLGLGGVRVVEGNLSMGTLVAFQTLLASFMAPVNALVGLGSKLQETEGDMNRLDDVLNYEMDEQISTVADDETVKLSGAVSMKRVTFGYSRQAEPLIDDFNLELVPGARVALVGGSGSGKSTLARIICGLYAQWDGDILFGGKSRLQISRETFANSVSYVDQDIIMFAGTIRENLTLWNRTIPEFHIVQACKDAAIHDDIAARQGGYDSLVNEGGGNFSGGQRQRLEIARALVSNPRLLLLDEATSALDALTEKQIDENLRARGCTCLIVAHRLSTIRDSDEIIVLDRGKVVQRGAHDDMIADADSPYAKLFQDDRGSA
jgi:NHLM bacteriocin system ABC transporter peptidase/ATP-binding protein